MGTRQGGSTGEKRDTENGSQVRALNLTKRATTQSGEDKEKGFRRLGEQNDSPGLQSAGDGVADYGHAQEKPS